MDLTTLQSKGYTFNVAGMLMSNSASALTKDLIDQAKKCNGPYKYDDYYGYAILDVIGGMMSKIHSRVVKKQWMDAWYHLEALTLFMNRASHFTMCDDGEWVSATDLVYGALLITTIRALIDSSKFDEDHIVNLEDILREMVEWGDMMSGIMDKTEYVKVLKGLGRKIFGKVTQKQEKAKSKRREEAFEEWLEGQSKKVKQERKRYVGDCEDKDKDDEDEQEQEQEQEQDKPKKRRKVMKWYGGKNDGDPDLQDPDFKVTGAWKEYKKHLEYDP